MEKEGANTCCWLPGNVDKPEWGRVTSVSVIEDGGLVAELLVESEMTGCRSVSRSVRLVAGQPWVEITNIVDKLPLMEKDGIHFGFNFHAENSHTMVDIPWGIMEVEKDQWRQANRFGLEQAQPLLHILADRNPEIRSLLEIDNPNVFVTILKPTANEGEIVVRLRSVSDTDEQVNLSFPERKPQSVKLCRIEENAAESVDGPLVLPPYGLVTLKLQYIY